jgi:hypothetical protein
MTKFARLSPAKARDSLSLRDGQIHWAVRRRGLSFGVGDAGTNNARKVERTPQEPKAGPYRFSGPWLNDSPTLVLGSLMGARRHMNELLSFLVSLEKRKISYRLEHNRDDSIMVLIAVPGKRWEVEFFGDGRVETEVFGNSSGVHTATVTEILSQLEN